MRFFTDFFLSILEYIIIIFSYILIIVLSYTAALTCIDITSAINDAFNSDDDWRFL